MLASGDDLAPRCLDIVKYEPNLPRLTWRQTGDCEHRGICYFTPFGPGHHLILLDARV